MARLNKTQREFNEEIDRLLAAKKIEEDRQTSEKYQPNIEIAGRLIECRQEPSDCYKKDLKRQLLIKLSEKEKTKTIQQKAASGNKWLSRFFSREPIWRLVPAQLALAVISLLAIAGIEFISRQEPILTGPPGGYSMVELLFFWLGIINNLFLIFIFLIRKNRLNLLQRVGWTYFLLAVPAIYGIIFSAQSQVTIQYTVFLGIFLVYLLVEWLYDYVLKSDFRDNWRKNWKFSVPYLVLYYAMNYGFIVMNWKVSLLWGIILLALFVIQIRANLISHPRSAK